MSNVKKICFNACAIFLIILSIMVIIFIDNGITKWIIATIGFSFGIILLYVMNINKNRFDPLVVKNKIRQFLYMNKLKLADKRGFISNSKNGAGINSDDGDKDQLLTQVVGSHIYDATEEIKNAISQYLDILNSNSNIAQHELAKIICTPIIDETKKLIGKELSRATTNQTILSNYINNDERIDSITVSDAKLYIPIAGIKLNEGIPFGNSNILNIKSLNQTHGVLESQEYRLNNISSDYYLEDKITSLTDMQYTIDHDWFNKMNKYIISLNTIDTLILRSYTRNGDLFVNTYMRGELDASKYLEYLYKFGWDTDAMMCPTFPQIVSIIKKNKETISNILLPANKFIVPTQVTENVIAPINSIIDKIIESDNLQDIYNLMSKLCVYQPFNTMFIKQVLDQYNDDLNRIIENAPALEQPMVVYRGIKREFIPPDEGKLYNNCGFLSTSFNKNIALNFSGFLPDRVIQEIILLPGCKGMIMSGFSAFGGEAEILLGSKTIYYIYNAHKKSNTLKLLPQSKYVRDEHQLNEMCVMVNESVAQNASYNTCQYIVLPQ